jgi:gliding motility-associated-like protein
MFRILFLFIIFSSCSFTALAQNYGSSSASSYNSPNSEVIGRVNFGSLPFGVEDINNPSLNGILNSTCTGYSDFTVGNSSNLDGNLTNAEFSTGVVKSQTYYLQVEGSFCSSNFSNSGNPNRALKVFVDFNDDGDFTDAGEQVYVSNVADGAYQQVDEPIFNTSFVIPLDAVVGELRMRIVYRRVGTSTFIWGLPNSGSTGSYPRGETEDYTLVVTGYIDEITPTDVSCNGSNDGQLAITPNVAAPVGVEFSINGLAGPWTSDLNYTNLPAGVYDVWARDAALSPQYVYEQYQLTIGAPSPINFSGLITSNFNGEDISCAAATDGELTITPFGGDPASYTYQYTDQLSNTTNVSATNVISNLGADTYDIVVIDGFGCESDPVAYQLEAPLPISISNVEINSDYNGFDVSCFNSCDAQLTITAAGGTAPYSFMVNGTNNGNNNIVSSVCSGNSSISVTDANNCELTTNFPVGEPTQVEITNVTTTTDYNGNDVSCFNATDATINIEANGGVASYSYSIDGGLTFPHASNAINFLGADTYNIVAQDANGCLSAIFNHNILEPSALGFDPIINTVPISCNGLIDGQISIQANGGTPNYSYSIDNGSNFQNSGIFVGLAAGNYPVVVQDENNCTESINYNLTEPDPVSFNASVTSDYNGFNVSCFELDDAEIFIAAQGGSGNYLYEINSSGIFSPIPLNSQVDNFSAGSYSLVVSDQNSCYSLPQNISITEPSLLQIVDITETSSISCFGGSDGELTISAQGGAGNYSYFVSSLYSSTNQNPFSVNNLSANAFDITVIDENGCISAPVNQLLSQPTALQPNLSTTNLGCSGEDIGGASITISGGTPSYSIVWSNNETSNSITNLLAGLYSVSISDNNDCELDIDFEITEPELQITITDIICYGQNQGQISVTLENANPASVYQFLWNDPNAQTTIDAVNLGAGVYTLTATDQFGCELSLTEIVAQPDSMNVFVDHTPICVDSPISKATVYASGGLSPYQYLWSTGDVSEQIEITTASSYSVLVTDDKNCQQQVDFNVDPLSLIDIDLVTVNPSCRDNVDGQISANVSGGYAPYQFLWSNNTEEQDLLGVGEGAYSLSVIDDKGCVTTSTATIVGEGQSCLYVYSAFSPNGDQNNDYWHIDNIELYPDALVEVFNRWGDRVFSTKRYLNSWVGAWKGTFNDNILPSATYYYVITLHNGEDPYVGTVTLVR